MKKKRQHTAMVVSTVRLPQKKMRELQYYLSLENMSFVGFVDTKASEFIQQYRQDHPDIAPAQPPPSA